MRISFVSHEYPPTGGGASTALEQYATRLAARGHAVQVVTIGLGPDTVQENQGGVEIVRLGVGRKSVLAPSSKELLASCYALRFKSGRHVKPFEPDYLCAFFAFPAGYAVRSIARILQVPLVVSLRGSDVPGFSKKRLGVFNLLLPYFFRKALQSADMVIPNGWRLSDLAAPYTKGARVEPLSNGVDTEVFHPIHDNDRSRESALRLLFVGQLISRKHCLEVARALAQLPTEGRPLEVTFAGTGPLQEEIKACLARAPERVRVRMLGYVERSAMPELYRQHDMLLQFSDSEGVSNVVLEALASGLGVLAAPGAIDPVLSSVGGIRLVSQVSPEMIGAEIESLSLETVNGLKDLARNAAESLGWDSQISRFELLIQSF